jgi:hypothetical protein
MFWRELVLAISLISFGSNQTFFRPHRITDAASRFWSFKELILAKKTHGFRGERAQIYQFERARLFHNVCNFDERQKGVANSRPAKKITNLLPTAFW